MGDQRAEKSPAENGVVDLMTALEASVREARAERDKPLLGSLRSWGGKYRYRCELGHQVVSSKPYMDTCPVPLRPVASGEPCGADIEERIVPYRAEGQPDA